MNVAQFFSRTDKSVISNWFWTVDKGALVSIFALIVYGPYFGGDGLALCGVAYRRY